MTPVQLFTPDNSELSPTQVILTVKTELVVCKHGDPIRLRYESGVERDCIARAFRDGVAPGTTDIGIELL